MIFMDEKFGAKLSLCIFTESFSKATCPAADRHWLIQRQGMLRLLQWVGKRGRGEEGAFEIGRKVLQ